MKRARATAARQHGAPRLRVAALLLGTLLVLGAALWLALPVGAGHDPAPGAALEGSLQAAPSAGWASPAPAMVTAALGAADTEYERTQTLESWRTTSEEVCATYAHGLLTRLRATGVELVQAGYLDLSGESWGCVLRTPEGAAYTITLLPERPFGLRSDTNQLVVCVLHYLEPPEEQGAQYEQ